MASIKSVFWGGELLEVKFQCAQNMGRQRSVKKGEIMEDQTGIKEELSLWGS